MKNRNRGAWLLLAFLFLAMGIAGEMECQDREAMIQPARQVVVDDARGEPQLVSYEPRR